MKHSILLTLFLAVTGYGQEFNQRDVLARLKALEAEVARQRPVPVRWATADRSKIATALYARSREKLEELKQTEKLSPEQEAKVAEYDALNRELTSKPPRMPALFVRAPRAASDLPPLPPTELSAGLKPLPLPPSVPQRSQPAPTGEDQAYDALVRRVAAAKAPVAAIIDRRAQVNAKYFGRELIEQLIADYMKSAKERYDLVVDTSHDSSSSRTVLYRIAGEVPDITEGIIKFFREWEKVTKP